MSESKFTNPMLAHYEALLHSLSIAVDEQGLCYTSRATKQAQKEGESNETIRLPLAVLGKRLVLPTDDFLLNKLEIEDGGVAFHPFSESVIRGESEINEWLRTRIVNKVTTLISIFMVKIATIAADADAIKQLSTTQVEALSNMGDADSKTVDVISKLVTNIASTANSYLVHIYLRHSGKSDEKDSYKRYAKVTFPLYEELVEGKEKILGVTLRVKDRKFIKALLEYIYPKISAQDGYSFGSNSPQAPYYHATINVFAKIATPISSRIHTWRKQVPQLESARVHTQDWLETFDAAAKASSFVKAQKHNIGSGGNGIGTEEQVLSKPVASVLDDEAGKVETNREVAVVAAQQTPPPNLFATEQPAATTNLFSDLTNPANTSLFSSTTATPPAFTTSAPAQASNLFSDLGSGAQQPTTDLFADVNKPKAGLFDNVNPVTGATSAPATGGLFGNSQPVANSSGDLFGDLRR